MKVSILAVRSFLEVVTEYGVSRDQFLSAVGLDPRRLDDLDGRLTLAELDRLHEVALTLTGDAALGIRMGERAHATAYDVVGHLASHASTLGDSIERIFRYSRLLSDGIYTLETRDDVATITCQFTGDPSSAPVRMRAELTVIGFLRLVRSFCEDAHPHAAQFQHAAPPYRAEYARLFGGKERFEQPVTALHFDRAILSREAVHKNPRLSAVLTREAERMLGRLEHGTTHAERVRDILASWRSGETPAMTAVARRLGMSVRSLRRRLEEEGASFPRLMEEAQLITAKHLLEMPERSIAEIAFQMGYSDASAFNRAFRRWCGMTPGQYRAGLQ